MTYIVNDNCIKCKLTDCVDVCPVDCIYTKDEDDMFYIQPDECIDCAACVDPCPVDAIYYEDDVPEKWASFIDKAKNFDFTGLSPSQRKG